MSKVRLSLRVAIKLTPRPHFDRKNVVTDAVLNDNHESFLFSCELDGRTGSCLSFQFFTFDRSVADHNFCNCKLITCCTFYDIHFKGWKASDFYFLSTWPHETHWTKKRANIEDRRKKLKHFSKKKPEIVRAVTSAELDNDSECLHEDVAGRSRWRSTMINNFFIENINFFINFP